MFESLLNVKYLTSKNCLCSLSAKNFKHLQNNFVKLVYNDDNESSYVSVDSSSASIDDQSIGINSLFAKALGIDDNSFLAVSEIPRPPTIQTVGITTIDDDDHHVLESLAERVQSTLLEQIRVLSVGRKFIIWIGKTIHVTVTVCDIKPFSPGIIDNLSEVVIKPPEKESRQMLDHNKSEKQIVQKCRKETLHFLADYVDREENLILRVAPFVELIEKIGGPNHPFNVFVSKNYVPSYLKDTIISPKFFLAKLLNDENEEKFVYVRLYLFEDILHAFKLNKICFGNIFVSDVLMKHLNCDLGSRLLLQPYNSPLPEIQELEIYAKRNFSINISEHFKQYLADSCKDQEFVLNQNVILEVSDKLRCYVRFQPCEAKFCVVTPDFVRNCKLVTINESIPQKEEEKNEFSANKYTTDVANYQDIIDTCIFLFGFNTKVFCKMYNVLITGKSGTGKTTLVKIISHAIKSSPYFIYTKKINCKSIKGKTVESLHKLFTTILFDLIRHQPSVLILDNFQVLCENVNEGDALVQNGVYFNRASEMLEGLFQNFCEHNAVGILATAESTAKLNKNVYATRGNSLFKNVYNINQFDKSDRRQLLEFFFSSCTYDEVDLDKLAEKTESFVMQDLVDFANKTLFESYQEDCDQDVLKITTHHCEKALEIVTETSLAGVNLHPPGNRYLDDIGGLTDAKKILVEAMLWPAKYPNLFTNAPLRLAAGFLLYGPPGTGKTILAGAAAKHCGLRLISIKGPELLSKYIGASEQAVRDVFQRAQSAKPCILFFDEFDSLAPRRGHDNTGVTDRVVNQLLTQLDGIESLSGVFVLAATSRPDLLDPALLRPGRLDIHVRCSLPDEVSRVEILKVLSKSLKLASDVNLAELARATEGFSGADLQAVLYSAQLDSVKGLLEDEVEMQEFQSEIHQVQLEEALKNTRPSLSTAERMKYEHIYRIFENGGSSDFMPGSRATLA